MIDWHRTRNVALTCILAGAGGAAFAQLGLPAAWLTGSTLLVAAAAMAGLRAEVPLPLRHVVFVLLGTSIGTSVTPILLGNVVHWPLTLAAVGFTTVVVHAAVQSFLMRIAGWDWSTAFFASVPGMTSYVVVVALPTAADVRQVAVAQSLRALLLVALTPYLLEAGGMVAAATPATTPGTLEATAISLGAGTAGGWLLHRMAIPAGWLLGALLASAALHGTGTVAGDLPAAVVIVALAGIGAVIGSRFSGFDTSMLRRSALTSIGAFAIAMAVAGLCAWLAAALAGQPLAQVALAFAPGGIDVMTALAFAMHLDSVFVAAHQLVRFIMIVLVVPWFARAMPRAAAPSRT